MVRKQTKRQKAALKGWATRRARAKVRKLFSVGGLSVARINSFKGKLMAHAVPLEVLQQRQQTGAQAEFRITDGLRQQAAMFPPMSAITHREQKLVDAARAIPADRYFSALRRLVRGWFP